MDVDKVVEEVIKRIKTHMENETVEIEASGRHVHLSQEDLEALFGKGSSLTLKKKLSQPGEFLSEQKVNIVGPKGIITNVSILGPVRKQSQVEVSITDTSVLGVEAVIRESGKLNDTPGVVLATEKGCKKLKEGLIVAQRHIHLIPEDAKKFQVKNGDTISFKVENQRSAILSDVVVRVSEKYSSRIHIDYDEANAIHYQKGMRGKILR